MKKNILALGLLMVGIISISSCKKCGHCEYQGVSEGTVCYKSGAVGNAALSSMQSSCELSGGVWVTD